MNEPFHIEAVSGEVGDDLRAMLIDLIDGDQDAHPGHPRETREELAARLRPAPRFSGENHILVARAAGGGALGLCWVVLFDPGTGLEAEIAELYVRPDARDRGVATELLQAATDLLRERSVMFACVWTRDDNEPAMAAYRAAGFRATEQAVLTWLPTAERR